MTIDADIAETTLLLSHRFEATPERVFDAWVTKAWGEWLGPKDFRCEVTEIDARPGGRYLVAMRRPDGSPVKVTGVYREVTRPQKLVLTWKGDYHPSETLITVTFRADGSGTLMTLKQEGFTDAQHRNGHRQGWAGEGGCFEKLATLLARKAA